MRLWRKQSYHRVPALAVRGDVLRHALRTTTLAWMFGVIWLATATGSHLKVFARGLGFSDLAFGILGALPFAGTFGQLIASAIIERTGLVKYQFLHCATVHRLLWLAAAAVPLVFVVPSTAATVALLTVIGASWFFNALAAPAWLTWMGTMIPRRIRGRYFAQRERLAMLTQAAAVIALGVLIDWVYDPAGAAVQPAAMWMVSIILAVGAVLGTVDILLFGRIPEVVAGRDDPTDEQARRQGFSFRGMILAPLADRSFRHYVLFAAMVTFSATASNWYLWLNAMDNLGFGALATNCLFLVIGPLTGIWAAGPLGKAIDRWGRRPILMLCTIGASLSLLPFFFAAADQTLWPGLADWLGWLLATVGGWFGRPGWAVIDTTTPAGAYAICMIGCMIGGASWSGISLAQMGIVLGFADGSGRSKYVAASSLVISTGGVLGGVAGGLVTQQLAWLRVDPWQVGPFAWNQWHVALAIGVLTRSAAVAWLIGMTDAGSTPVRTLARALGSNAFNAAATRLFYPLRVFGWQRARRGDDSRNN